GKLVNRMGVTKIGENKTNTFNNFPAGSQLFSIYASDNYGDGDTDALYSWIEVDSGDGTGTLRSVVGEAEATFQGAQGANMLNLYGVYGKATQNNDTNIEGNLVGVLGSVSMNEGDNGDVPPRYIAGVLAEYETPGRNPGSEVKGALVGLVKDGSNNQPDAAVVAYLEDDESGGIDYNVDAAFKAINGRDMLSSGFQYGLDLSLADIQNADIRLSSGVKILTGADDPPTVAASDGSIYLSTAGKLFLRTGGAWVEK
ncbi:MAG: hypothetical protein ACLFSQ_02750, partial [Candidatus Zixiibacteriota bacterium]